MVELSTFAGPRRAMQARQYGAGQYGGAMAEKIERILCITSYAKGQDFMRQCADMGVRPTLLTVDKHKGSDWPRECLEDVALMPENLTRDQIINTVSWM